MSERIFFLSPDSNATIGGVKQLYRQVDVLGKYGIDAKILHRRKGFKITWFAHNTPTISWSEFKFRDNDILVLPEIYGPQMAKTLRVDKKKTFFSNSDFWEEELPPIRKVIFNQNAYNTFARTGFDPTDLNTPYLDPTVVATIVVSEDSKEYVQSIFPDITIHRIRNAINAKLFSFESKKKKQICFMPRKHREEAQEVINIAKIHGALKGYNIRLIENVTETETAKIMKESLLFLSFGYPEGFSLPPAEAMATGCIVIGYHGGGGKEYFLPEHSFPIEAADIRGYVKTLESVLRSYSNDPQPFNTMRVAASQFITNEYSFQNEEADICSAWSAILGRAIS
ncbi:MAG TPA: glycosyltransferase [Candidatus Kapabacteria bacterium]|nr:glycosyltransferase [Candidatus Kapabacteria bacterium]